ncbi:hypothetical protein HMPREF9439_01689 [Parasutterella excrementihominis YIT 11859]|uniref:Uncharacterized protein n=1 Tax=Parasutterella excrementihominis YIT 11859 TaxID=762966 RepID=F3QL72_9BURK|nr:hypothetical protein HMPREF9439_01689 [Parasutterella excrementihominis YIT 11859]
MLPLKENREAAKGKFAEGRSISPKLIGPGPSKNIRRTVTEQWSATRGLEPYSF